MCTDNKDDRVGTHVTLNMFLTRVTLGHPHIARTPQQFKKPPCRQTGCATPQNCIEQSHGGDCHSVIGVGRNQGLRLLFREFIVYHLDQAYPEFLIEYERV